jgi:HNH endonuclease
MVMSKAWHPTSPQQVHRVVYEVVNGSIPAGSEVSHLCHVRLCVNPAHLVAESHAANMERNRGRLRRPRPSGAAGRLTDTVPRYLALVGSRRRRAYPAELIARRIRDDGSVWGVVVDYGISYAHACRIRAGWRPR